ncbi:MAG: betaine--homocysteine S-methyltransferase [Gammaproteobacteria bacterium]
MTNSESVLTQLIRERGTLLADGATGTTLFASGLTSGDAPELWNADEPDKIRALHRGFMEAGSDIILTNTFGGTRHRLKLHSADDRVEELNERAAILACEVASEADRRLVVAGSVGPTGELFEPLGALTLEEAVNAFSEQIRGLKKGGADVVWIETMSAAEEILAAATAAIQEGMPYCFTCSFDTAGKTMMGLEPAAIHDLCTELTESPLALGANCGVGAPDILSSLLDMSAANPDTPIIVKGNCGIPQFQGAEVVYSGTPELMAEYAGLALDAGASIIGGCCGTTKEHIAAMRSAIDQHTLRTRPTLEDITSALGELVNNTASHTKKVKPTRGRRRHRT